MNRADAAAPVLQLVSGRQQDARAAHADGVAEGDRSAVHIDRVLVEPEVAHHVAVAVGADLRVAAGHVAVGERDIALLAAAEHDRRGAERLPESWDDPHPAVRDVPTTVEARTEAADTSAAAGGADVRVGAAGQQRESGE